MYVLTACQAFCEVFDTYFFILFNSYKIPTRYLLNHHFTDVETTPERLSDLAQATQLRNHKT